jgi:RNA polymerase sigma-70 factor (ECF subfamily)
VWAVTWPRRGLAVEPNDATLAPEEPDDETLVAACRTNPHAFAALYHRYVGPVYRYCHVRLGTTEAAEDATSAVFVKAMAALPRYRPGSFPGWLYRIAANTVLDIQRRSRPTVPFDTLAHPSDPEPSPEEQLIRRSRRDDLLAALATLPDEQRAAVELQLAGWPGERIAAALDRSPEAVRMLRYRAMSRLRAILSDPDDPSGGPA